MPSFGGLLRKYRQNSKDPDSSKQLSQERLGELLGKELGMFGGYSGAAVSDWERGKSKIHADDRRLLVGLINVLYQSGGLKTTPEADELLEEGNYRALSLDEKKQIFPKETLHTQTNSPVPGNRQGLIQFLEERIFYGNENLKASFADAEAEPAPSWLRKVVVLTNNLTAGWSLFHWLRLVGWAWAFALGWLILPSLRWPFADQEQAAFAMALYIAGALSTPLLIGLLTNTRNNPFWQERGLADHLTTRLYTYQGAGIGFHLGYFSVFMINLAIYSFGLRSNTLLELIEITFLIMFSDGCARLVPYNLLKAYQRLDLADGGVFFVFFMVGPVWGLFFYVFHPLFLEPLVGWLIILSALTLMLLAMAWQQRRTGATVIPAHWWAIFYGSIFVLYEITITKDLFSVVALAGLMITLSALLALGRVRFTLWGMIGFLTAACLVLIVLSLNLWVGRVMAGITLLAWWRWGKGFLSFPPGFWGVILALAGCIWMLQHQWLSDIQASIIFGVATILLLLREHKLALSNSTG